MTTRQLLAALLVSAATVKGALASPTDAPATRLQAAHSLRCHFSEEQAAKWVNGQRALSDEKLDPNDNVSTVVYDSINLAKGTARIIGNAGAADVTVRRDSVGALWIVERSPVGFQFTTTVFPIYAVGTSDFIVVESRTAFIGSRALAEQSTGSCAVLD